MNYKLCTKIEDKWRTFGFVNDGKNGGQYISISLAAVKELAAIMEKTGKEKMFLTMFEDKKPGAKEQPSSKGQVADLIDEIPFR